MEQITIKNISTATVVIVSQDTHFRRELAPGREIALPKEVYDELIFDTGFNGLISDHYIVLKGGEAEAITMDEVKTVSAAEIKQMLEKQDVTAFAKFIPNAAPAEKESVIQLAIALGITNNAITALINKYCGVDVIKAIAAKHEVEA